MIESPEQVYPNETLVRILSKREIENARSGSNRIKALTFNESMFKYCGQIFRIYRKIDGTKFNVYELKNTENAENTQLNRVNAWGWNDGMFQVIDPNIVTDHLRQMTNNEFNEDLL